MATAPGMESASPAPAAELVISTLDQLKALSDPLRLEMIETMSEEPDRGWTAKELAERLGTKQTKLYHHLKLLERHGMVRVVGTRVVSGILERRYGLTARTFKVDRSLLVGGDDVPMASVVDAMFEKARTEIVESVQAGLIEPEPSEAQPRRMAISMTHVRLSPANLRKVMRLIDRLNQIDEEADPHGEEYSLLVAFYPRATRTTRGTRKEKDR